MSELLHCYVKSGKLSKPPSDLAEIRLSVETGHGHGKGGMSYPMVSSWSGGSIVKFSDTAVLGEVDSPLLARLSFVLKGVSKSDSKEMRLGVGALKTNPKVKQKAYLVDIVNLEGEGSKNVGTTVICQLEVILYRNKFPVNLSAENVSVLTSETGKAGSSGTKVVKTAEASEKEYQFLLNRKLNWPLKKDKNGDRIKSTFNEQNELKVNQDFLKNFQQLYSAKADERERAAAKLKEFVNKYEYRNTTTKLSYGKQPTRVQTEDPLQKYPAFRNTSVGPGYIGNYGTSPPRVKPGKGYKRTHHYQAPRPDVTNPDRLKIIYEKTLEAEKRRLLRQRKKKEKARFQSSLARVKAKIIKQKMEEDEERDAELYRIVARSDEEVKKLRDKIQERQRRIAYLDLQKHINEAEARRRAKQRKIEEEKRMAREALEREANEAIRMARSMSPRRAAAQEEKMRSRSEENRPLKPYEIKKNAIPLRGAIDTEAIRKKREASEKAARLRERKRQEKETKEALQKAHSGLAGAHAEIKRLPPHPPMPRGENRISLRDVDKISKRAQRIRERKQAALESKAIRVAAATAASEIMRKEYLARREKPSIAGVHTTNKFPLRQVETPASKASSTSKASSSGTGTGSEKGGPLFDFSDISRKAEEAVAATPGDDEEFDLSDNEFMSGGVRRPRMYTYTMEDGTIISAKSMSALDYKVHLATRSKLQSAVKKTVRKKVKTQKKMSKSITSNRNPDEFGPRRNKVGTPVNDKRYKKFYDPRHKRTAADDDADESEEVIRQFNSTLDKFTDASDDKKDDWMNIAKEHVEVLSMKSNKIQATSNAIGKKTKVSTSKEALVSGNIATSTTSTMPGFLSEYHTSCVDTASTKQCSMESNQVYSDKLNKKQTRMSERHAGSIKKGVDEIARDTEDLLAQVNSGADMDASELNKLKDILEGQDLNITPAMAVLLQELQDPAPASMTGKTSTKSSKKKGTSVKKASVKIPKTTTPVSTTETSDNGTSRTGADSDDDDDEEMPAWMEKKAHVKYIDKK